MIIPTKQIALVLRFYVRSLREGNYKRNKCTHKN